MLYWYKVLAQFEIRDKTVQSIYKTFQTLILDSILKIKVMICGDHLETIRLGDD